MSNPITRAFVEAIDWDAVDSLITCPMCGSPASTPLGRLGGAYYVRCRACGMDYQSIELE